MLTRYFILHLLKNCKEAELPLEQWSKGELIFEEAIMLVCKNLFLRLRNIPPYDERLIQAGVKWTQDFPLQARKIEVEHLLEMSKNDPILAPQLKDILKEIEDKLNAGPETT